jgi:hypothetical protein
MSGKRLLDRNSRERREVERDTVVRGSVRVRVDGREVIQAVMQLDHPAWRSSQRFRDRSSLKAGADRTEEGYGRHDTSKGTDRLRAANVPGVVGLFG